MDLRTKVEVSHPSRGSSVRTPLPAGHGGQPRVEGRRGLRRCELGGRVRGGRSGEGGGGAGRRGGAQIEGPRAGRGWRVIGNAKLRQPQQRRGIKRQQPGGQRDAEEWRRRHSERLLRLVEARLDLGAQIGLRSRVRAGLGGVAATGLEEAEARQSLQVAMHRRWQPQGQQQRRNRSGEPRHGGKNTGRGREGKSLRRRRRGRRRARKPGRRKPRIETNPKSGGRNPITPSPLPYGGSHRAVGEAWSSRAWVANAYR